MTRKLLLALGMVLSTAGLALADEPAAVSSVPLEPTDSVASTPDAGCQPSCCNFDPCCCDQNLPQCWVGLEYLLWWVKNAPLPVLNSNLNYGAFSGMRLTAGTWLDPDRTVGVETSWFLLEQGWAGQNAASTFQPIALPFVGSVFPSAALQSHSRLWGAEANGLFNAMRTGGSHVDLLAGFRFLSLEENLAAQTAFNGGPLGLQTNANYQTQSQFYGGQVGAKVGGRSGRLTANVIGKVALGDMHEGLNQSAMATVSAPGFTNTIGVVRRETRDRFAVLPQVTLQLGYDMTDAARVFVGYDFLYVSDVLRAGNNANTGSGIGPFHGSDFWAQGISFGLQLRF